MNINHADQKSKRLEFAPVKAARIRSRRLTNTISARIHEILVKKLTLSSCFYEDFW